MLALAMAAEARGQLNPEFTDLDSTDTVLDFMDPALLDTPLVPLTLPEASKVSEESVKQIPQFTVMAISDTELDTVTVFLPAMLILDLVTVTWEREKPKLNLNLIMVMAVMASMVVSMA